MNSPGYQSEGAKLIRLGPLEVDLDLIGFPHDQQARVMARLDAVTEPTEAHYAAKALKIRLRACGTHPLLYDSSVHAAPAGDWVMRHDFQLERKADGWYGEVLSVSLAVEYALRWIAGIEMLAVGGLAVHSSAAVLGFGAHLFLGPSGAGKSTIAFEGDFDSVICDDLNLIAPDLDGVWYVWPSPFWGQFREQTRSIPVPLVGIWTLEGRERTEATPIETAEAAVAMFSRIIDISAAERAPGMALERIARVVEQVPSAKLSWRRGEPLSQLLAERTIAAMPEPNVTTPAERADVHTRETVAIEPVAPPDATSEDRGNG